MVWLQTWYAGEGGIVAVGSVGDGMGLVGAGGMDGLGLIVGTMVVGGGVGVLLLQEWEGRVEGTGRVGITAAAESKRSSLSGTEASDKVIWSFVGSSS
jgi:hypothetical protein